MSRGGRPSLLALGSAAVGVGVVSIVVGIVGIATAGGARTAAAGTPAASSVDLPSETAATPTPTPLASASASPTVASPTSPVVPDLTGLAGTCRSIPAGTIPPFLRFDGRFSSGSATDPRTGRKTFVIVAGLDASPLDRTAPFSFVGLLLPVGAQAPAGRQRAIDALGTVQLWYASDRSGEYKGIRTFRDGQWTMRTDDAADALTVQLSPNEIRFYWSGLQQGERFAFASAGAVGCDALGTDAVASG